MKLVSFLLATIFFTVFVKEAAFLECYVCDSTNDSGCEHPDESYVRYCGPDDELTTVETETENPSTTTVSESTNESPSSDTTTSLSPSETTASESSTDSSPSDTTISLSPSETTDPESTTDSAASDTTTELSTSDTTNSESEFTNDPSSSDITTPLSDSTTTTESTSILSSSEISPAEENTSESAPESSSTDRTDTSAITPENKSLQRKRRSLVAQAADQLIRNYRLIDRSGRANDDSYACFTFTDQDKTSIRRGCVAIPPTKDGCPAVRDQLGITDSTQGDCSVCLMDRCNGSSSVKMSIAVILFVMIAKLIF